MVVNLGKEQTGQSISWSRRQADERSQLISLSSSTAIIHPPASPTGRGQDSHGRETGHTTVTPAASPVCRTLAALRAVPYGHTHPGTSREKGSSSSSVVVTRSPCTRGEPQGGRASSQPACRRNGGGAREASTHRRVPASRLSTISRVSARQTPALLRPAAVGRDVRIHRRCADLMFAWPGAGAGWGLAPRSAKKAFSQQLGTDVDGMDGTPELIPSPAERVCTFTPVQMRGSSTVCVVPRAPCRLRELQQQRGEDDDETAARESSHHVRPSRGPRTAVRRRRCRCGRRRVGPCGERSCQCRHLCQDARAGEGG